MSPRKWSTLLFGFVAVTAFAGGPKLVRVLDTTKTASGTVVYQIPESEVGGRYLVHALGHPNSIPVLAAQKKYTEIFDTYGLVTLSAPSSSDGSVCPNSTNMVTKTLVGDGTKVFVQDDGSGPVLYLIYQTSAKQRPLQPGTNTDPIPNGDVIWLQTKKDKNERFDYFVFLGDTTGCTNGQYGKELHVEAYPSDPNDPDFSPQCFAERPDQKQGWAVNLSSPVTSCIKEAGSGSGNEPDHPH